MLYGCTKKQSNSDSLQGISYLKARVVETDNIDCHRPLLDFTEDAAGIQQLTGTPDKLFILDRLPAGFNVLDKKLFVAVSLPEPGNAFPCTTLGIAYPHLQLLEAKGRE